MDHTVKGSNGMSNARVWMASLLLLTVSSTVAQSQWPGERQAVVPNSGRDAYGGSNGSQGCYFGECPEDGSPAPPARPRGQPAPRPPQDPWSSPPTPTPNYSMTQICQTPTLWCRLWQSAPVGASCYCQMPFGVFAGMTVPMR